MMPFISTSFLAGHLLIKRSLCFHEYDELLNLSKTLGEKLALQIREDRIDISSNLKGKLNFIFQAVF